MFLHARPKKRKSGVSLSYSRTHTHVYGLYNFQFLVFLFLFVLYMKVNAMSVDLFAFLCMCICWVQNVLFFVYSFIHSSHPFTFIFVLFFTLSFQLFRAYSSMASKSTVLLFILPVVHFTTFAAFECLAMHLVLAIFMHEKKSLIFERTALTFLELFHYFIVKYFKVVRSIPR
jgi:hypothetical protein